MPERIRTNGRVGNTETIDGIAGARPLVSVVIPCFNQARYLGLALESVWSQGYPSLQAVVVDDGSSDETSEIARRHAATVLRQPRRGPGAARTAGLMAARGEFILFLDADDELLPGAIESGVTCLQASPSASCVARRCVPMDWQGNPVPYEPAPPLGDDLYREWLTHNFVWTPGAAVFRRQRLLDAGGFPSDAGAVAEYAVYLQLSRSGGVVFDDRDVVRYRQHDANLSRDSVLMLAHTIRVLSRERSHVPRTHLASFREGERSWRAFYGERIVHQLRNDWRGSRRGRPQIAAVWMLVRHCPAVAFGHVRRKVARLLAGVPPETLEPRASPIAGSDRTDGNSR